MKNFWARRSASRPRIRLSKIEEKPEARKAGGVYYTPRYIVDYIVANTVGEKLKGRSPVGFVEAAKKVSL